MDTNMMSVSETCFCRIQIPKHEITLQTCAVNLLILTISFFQYNSDSFILHIIVLEEYYKSFNYMVNDPRRCQNMISHLVPTPTSNKLIINVCVCVVAVLN